MDENQAVKSRRVLGFSLGDLWGETMADLRQNRLRSFLTMVGIAWGVAAIIILVAVGEGIRQGQMDKSALLGRDILIIWGGTTSIPGPGIRPGKRIHLTYEDFEALRRDAYWIKKISPELDRDDLVSVSASNRGNFSVSGVLTDYLDIRTIEIGKGRTLTEADMRGSARVCIIGDDVDKQLYNGKATPEERLVISGLDYRVVGVIRRKEQNSNYSGPDNTKIFIPYPAMRRDFPYQTAAMGVREIGDIIAQPVSIEQGESAEYQVRQVLGRRHTFDPLDEDAVPVWNTIVGAKMMNTMFDSMALFMGFVAVVTLMLGGLGVMNIMLVSVRARTHEIGLRKAIGATRRSVLAMFFFESLLISLGSGLFGYAGAMGLCAAVNSLPLPDFFSGMIVTRWVGLSALGFLLFVSLAAAFYPSYTAACLDPVEALRYEE